MEALAFSAKKQTLRLLLRRIICQGMPGMPSEKVQDYLTAKADAKGVDLADLVNDMLKKDIELIEMGR